MLTRGSAAYRRAGGLHSSSEQLSAHGMSWQTHRHRHAAQGQPVWEARGSRTSLQIQLHRWNHELVWPQGHLPCSPQSSSPLNTGVSCAGTFTLQTRLLQIWEVKICWEICILQSWLRNEIAVILVEKCKRTSPKFTGWSTLPADHACGLISNTFIP